jgi:hypothetical protein
MVTCNLAMHIDALSPIDALDRRLSGGFSREWPQAIAHSPQATRSALDGFRATPDNRASVMSQPDQSLRRSWSARPCERASSQSAARAAP